jgi:diadenosine tetraphosphate (Ap4A) HIT family hydrolase
MLRRNAVIRKDILGNEIRSECIGCGIVSGDITLPGGIIYDGRSIILGADPEIPISGFLVITCKRHIQSFMELSADERLEIGDTIVLAEKAIKDLNIAKTVTLVQEERSRHFHIWIFPEQDWMKEKIGLGLMHMRDINTYTRENATKEDIEKVISTAMKIKTYIGEKGTSWLDR